MTNQIKKSNNVLFFVIIFIISQILNIRAGKYFVFVSFIFFISLFIFFKPKFNKYVLIGFILSICLCIRGLINGNYLLDILNDFLIFTPILISFLLNKNVFQDLEYYLTKYLTKSLVILIPLGIIIYKYMEYDITDIGLSRFNYNEEILLEYFSPIMAFLFAPYLVFYFNTFTKFEKILLFASLLFIAFMGIITLSRSLILYLFLPFILLFLYKIIINKIQLKNYIIYFIFIITSFTIINFIFINNSIISNLIDLLNARNTQQLDSGNITSDRYNEIIDYFKQNLSIFDYILGRGYGGQKVLTQNSTYIGGITMMHIGAAHVFLKGGALLLLYIYLPVFFIIIYYIKSNYYNISYLLIWFLIENNTTTTWNLSYPFLFYSLSISFLFNKIKFKK